MTLPLPDPTMIAGRRYWSKGAIRQWIAAIADKPAPEPRPDDEDLITSRQLRGWFGNASDMWLWRRLHPKERRGAAA